MQRVKIADLNALVAKTIEAKPTDALFTEAISVVSRQWIPRVVNGEWCWQPRHDYTGDDNAAMRLFDELPKTRSIEAGRAGTVTVSWNVYGTPMCDVIDADRRVATVLAWLAANGVEVEVVE